MAHAANDWRTPQIGISGITVLAGLVGLSSVASAQSSQGPGPWWMHDWGMEWGWGGMWLGHAGRGVLTGEADAIRYGLLTLALLAAIVLLPRLIGRMQKSVDWIE